MIWVTAFAECTISLSNSIIDSLKSHSMNVTKNADSACELEMQLMFIKFLFERSSVSSCLVVTLIFVCAEHTEMSLYSHRWQFDDFLQGSHSSQASKASAQS